MQAIWEEKCAVALQRAWCCKNGPSEMKTSSDTPPVADVQTGLIRAIDPRTDGLRRGSIRTCIRKLEGEGMQCPSNSFYSDGRERPEQLSTAHFRNGKQPRSCLCHGTNLFIFVLALVFVLAFAV